MIVILVVPAGVEPASPGPKPEMMDHYTTELANTGVSVLVLTLTLVIYEKSSLIGPRTSRANYQSENSCTFIIGLS